MEDDEEMWLNEDEEDDDEAAEEKSRSDEEPFPESYEKFMEAKKGIPTHPGQTSVSLVRLWNSLFLTPASYLFAVKESEDKENHPKWTSTGSFKFTFSHSAGAANGANGANSKAATSASATSPNGSSAKAAALPATPVVKVTCQHQFQYRPLRANYSP